MAAQIPDNVDEKGTYMLSGKFINQILGALRENQIRLAEESGPLQIRERGPQGTVLGLDTDVCPSS
jgi:hypothetical protein